VRTTKDSFSVGRTLLTPHERETADELDRLDPHFGGLYRHGLEFCQHIDEPGVVYLLAHAGREIGNGLVRLLSADGLAPSEEELEGIAEGEDHREDIAAMLGVAPDHPSVTLWMRTLRTLVRSAHVRGGPAPSGAMVVEAFHQLSGLLYGKIGPYFSTHADLDRLLTVEQPTAADVARAKELLSRLVQRHYFFGKLQHPAWLQPLAEAGYFNPPGLVTHADGTQRARAWPEGEYLVRVASADSAGVSRILLSIPPDNLNPIVWDVVARAAIELPASEARLMVRPLIRALRGSPAKQFYTHRFPPLVTMLATEGKAEAFKLAASLLDLSNGPAPVEMTEAAEESPEDSTAIAEAARRLRRIHRNNEWMLRHLDAYGLSVFLRDALPSLETLDSVRLLKLLAIKLEHAVALSGVAELAQSADPSTATPSAGATQTESDPAEVSTKELQSTNSTESRVANPRDDSHYWVGQLDYASEVNDVRTQLAVALTGVALRFSQRDRVGAETVDQILSNRPTDVFTRIRLTALAAAGELAPQAAVDRLVSDPELLDPPYQAREVAPFLRAQFQRSSPAAQRRFVEALELGPALDTDDTSESEEVIQYIANWKRRRLRWFHDRIPERLSSLASALGVEGVVPTAQEQSLDEVGSWSSGVHSGSYVSPLTVDALAQMSPQTLLEFLSTWQPDPDGSRFDAPSREGLASSLTAFAFANPGRASALAGLLVGATVSPERIAAVLSGFTALAKTGVAPEWGTISALISDVIERAKHATEDGSASPIEVYHWQGVLQAAVDTLLEMCAHDLIPDDAVSEAWRLAALATSSPVVWSDRPHPQAEHQSGQVHRQTSIGDLEFAAINSVPGHTVQMLVDLALWDNRRLNRASDATREVASERRDSGDEAVGLRLRTLLDAILEREGHSGRLARTAIGNFLPRILVLTGGWVLARGEDLFGNGATSPSSNPIWGAYLSRNPVYGLVFRQLRPWYVVAAVAAPDPTPGSENSEWSISRNLVGHIIDAVIAGDAAVGDPDQLVERVFERTRIEDRNRAYWRTFRDWSDAKGAISPDEVRRLVALWEWRLNALEGSAASPQIQEEADGLGWFLKTPHIPPDDAIRLGLRTLVLAGDRGQTTNHAWEQLDVLGRHDPVGTFEIVELLIKRALTRDYPFLPFESVGPPLRAALSSGDTDTVTRARRLINDMGNRGLLEFGQLLA